MKHIRIERKHGSWYAMHRACDYPDMIDLFGDPDMAGEIGVPTPFTDTMEPDAVLERLRALNADAFVYCRPLLEY